MESQYDSEIAKITSLQCVQERESKNSWRGAKSQKAKLLRSLENSSKKNSEEVAAKDVPLLMALRKTWTFRLMVTNALLLLETMLSLIMEMQGERMDLMEIHGTLQEVLIAYKHYVDSIENFSDYCYDVFEAWCLSHASYAASIKKNCDIPEDLIQLINNSLEKVSADLKQWQRAIAMSTSPMTMPIGEVSTDVNYQESDSDDIPPNQEAISKMKNYSTKPTIMNSEAESATSSMQVEKKKRRERVLESSSSEDENEEYVPKRKTMKKTAGSKISALIASANEMDSGASSGESITSRLLKEKKCRKTMSGNPFRDIAEEATGALLSELNTSGICSSISIPRGEDYVEFTSEEMSGDTIIKFEVYELKDCVGIEKNQWWKKVLFKSLYVLGSDRDQEKQLALSLQRMMVARIRRDKAKWKSTIKRRGYDT